MNVIPMCFRWLAVIGLTTGLAACGGYTTVDLGGTVTGLTTDGLVLANGDSTIAIPANATSYTFPSQIDDHGSFAVTVKTQPPLLSCSISRGEGTATGVAIVDANVVCIPLTHTVGGSISGLTVGGLVLVNGTDTVTLPANSTSFTFPTPVAEGTVYGVAVLTQPAPLTCSVTNGTKVMGADDGKNVQVACQ